MTWGRFGVATRKNDLVFPTDSALIPGGNPWFELIKSGLSSFFRKNAEPQRVPPFHVTLFHYYHEHCDALSDYLYQFEPRIEFAEEVVRELYREIAETEILPAREALLRRALYLLAVQRRRQKKV